MKKITMMILLISVMLLGNKLDKRINEIITLRVMGVSSDNIWEQFGVKDNNQLYFNGDKNIYECRDSKISSDTCSKVVITNNFLDIAQENSLITGYAYIYNDSNTITKENSYIIASNYMEEVDVQCILAPCPKIYVNDILKKLQPIYNAWKNKKSDINNFNDRYDTIKNIVIEVNRMFDIEKSNNHSSMIQYLPYNSIRLAITDKILNDLNISLYDFNTNTYLNNNSGAITDFSCEIYKLTGEIIRIDVGNTTNPDYETSPYFNEDACLLENTFPNEDNILRVEKRVLYSKKERKGNSKLQLNKSSWDNTWVLESPVNHNQENTDGLSVENTPELSIINIMFPYLTNEWSDDFIINAYILRNAVDNSGDDFKLYLASPTNRRLWKLISIIMNKNFKFYEDKMQAKSKIKELMQLRSIGFLDNNTWQELGFNSYKNDSKSEIKVKSFLNKYNEIKERYIGYLTSDKSRRIFKELGFKSLFLAKSLKNLELEMVNGRILNKYNTIFVKKLLQMENENLEEYKTELLTRKDEIINNLPANDDILLRKFFELTVAVKTLNAINTNGFTRTIPEFKLWLQKQERGLLSDYYRGFSSKYIILIDKVLNAVPDKLLESLKSKNSGDSRLTKEEIEAFSAELEEVIAPIKRELSDKYLELFDEIDRVDYEGSEISGGYDRIYLIYNELEIIELINRESRFVISGENIALKKANLIFDLKEIDVLDFQYKVLNKTNLFYDYENETNLFYLYNIYKENSVDSIQSVLEDLISSTIIVIKEKNNDIEEIKPSFQEAKNYSKVSAFLAVKPQNKIDSIEKKPTSSEMSAYHKVNYFNNKKNNFTKVHSINYIIPELFLKDMKMFSNVNYYLSDALINNHYFKYEMLGELIKNLSFSEKSGVNYENWVNAANQDGMEGNNIWEVLGIDRNASLSENADKDIDIVKVIENYKKLSDSVKKSLGLEVDLYNENYGTSTMFFDPITTMLLSKYLVDKGYYIDAGEDGYDGIFNREGEPVALQMEIDSIIEKIKIKHDEFRSEFDSSVNGNEYLGEFLDNIGSETIGEMNEIMSFINFSYSVDIRTGEMNGSLDFGVIGLNDKIWDRITAGVGQRGYWVLIGEILYETGKIVLPYAIGYITAEITNGMLIQFRNNVAEANRLHEMELRVPFRTDKQIFLSDFNRQVNAYMKNGNLSKEDAKKRTLKGYQEIANEAIKNTKAARAAFTKAIIAVGKASRELKKAQKERDDIKREADIIDEDLENAFGRASTAVTPEGKTEANNAVETGLDNKFEIHNKLDKANEKVKDKADELKKAEKKADEKQVAESSAEKEEAKAKANAEQAEEIAKPEKKKSCALMSGVSEDCNAGISPTGMAKVMNSIPRKLLEEINKKIRNIPPRECNIITRSCGNSVEPTAEEMKQMFDNINNEFMSDDEGCVWGEEGCSIFGNSESSGISYINQLWGPLPEMGQ